MFDNLDEIFDALQNILIQKKVSIFKKAYSLLIVFKINLIYGEEQEINIELNTNIINKGIFDNKNQIKLINLENEIKKMVSTQNNLIKILKALEDKANTQENEIKNLKNELMIKNGKIINLEKALKVQKYELEEIKNWKNMYEAELDKMLINKRNNIIFYIKIDSKIINKIEEF